jgi:LmbE family N-acetylglucosaminyl deacetylase
MKSTNKTALSFLCHPDDAEFMTAGTLALLRDAGWDIVIATMTAGDCGSNELDRNRISEVRKAEASKSVSILEGGYLCAGLDDVFVMYDKPSLIKTIEIIRKVRPTIVFAASPQDYFVDHEDASKLVRTACFACGIPNVETEGVGTFNFVPYLYYADPLGGSDIFGNRVKSSIYVDISSKIDVKEEMLCCHKSQRDWLLAHHGIDEYVISMKKAATEKGFECGFDYAEGFRQHLGHAYPQDNILNKELNKLVKIGD